MLKYSFVLEKYLEIMRRKDEEFEQFIKTKNYVQGVRATKPQFSKNESLKFLADGNLSDFLQFQIKKICTTDRRITFEQIFGDEYLIICICFKIFKRVISDEYWMLIFRARLFNIFTTKVVLS